MEDCPNCKILLDKFGQLFISRERCRKEIDNLHRQIAAMEREKTSDEWQWSQNNATDV